MQSAGAGAAVAGGVAMKGLAAGAVVVAVLAVAAVVAGPAAGAGVAGLAVAARVAAGVDVPDDGLVSRPAAAAIEPMVAASAVASAATPMTRVRLPCALRISDDLVALCEVSLSAAAFRIRDCPRHGTATGTAAGCEPAQAQ
jgi:hypothetical protein